MSKPKRRLRPNAATLYNRLDELMASTTEPLTAEKRRYHLTRIYQGLAELETSPSPGAEAWRLCADAVNMTETIIHMGLAEDATGLLPDAVHALGEAGARHVDQAQAIRLSGPGIQAVRAVLASYAELIGALPARTMIRAHRETCRRMQDILRGAGQAHDVVIDLKEVAL